MGMRDKPTAPASLWQNGVAERLIGSIRRECVDHIIVLGEAHLRRILRSYADYCNGVRTHRYLNKDAPVFRPAQRTGSIKRSPSLADFITTTSAFRFSVHTGALKRLAARNVVERAVNEDDRRARLCKLTAAGAALLAKIENSARAAHRDSLGDLTEREQALFIEMVQRVVVGNSNRDSAAALFDWIRRYRLPSFRPGLHNS
jgi:hypothetical protein